METFENTILRLGPFLVKKAPNSLHQIYFFNYLNDEREERFTSFDISDHPLPVS